MSGRIYVKKLDNHAFYLSVLFGLSIILLLPSLDLPWSIVDDGQLINFSIRINNSLKAGDYFWIFRNELMGITGRYLPGFWLYFWGQYLFFGLNPLGYHLMRIVLLGVFVTLFYLVLIRLTSSKKLAFLSSFVFLIFNTCGSHPDILLSNWYRNGTAEPAIITVLMASIWLFLKGSDHGKAVIRNLLIGAGSIITIIAFFSKETALFFIPVVIFWLLFMLVPRLSPEKDILCRKYLCIYAAVISIIGIMVRVLANIVTKDLIKEGNQPDNYIFTPARISESINAIAGQLLLWEALLFLAVLIIFIIRIIRVLKEKEKMDRILFTQVLFFLWALFGIGIHLPWYSHMYRYLLLAMPGIAVFTAIGLSDLFRFISTISAGFLRRTATATASIAIIISLLSSVLGIINFISYYRMHEFLNAEFRDSMCETLADGDIVYFNLPYDHEFIYEMMLYLKLLYHKDGVGLASIYEISDPVPGSILCSYSEFDEVNMKEQFRDNNGIYPQNELRWTFEKDAKYIYFPGKLLLRDMITKYIKGMDVPAQYIEKEHRSWRVYEIAN